MTNLTLGANRAPNAAPLTLKRNRIPREDWPEILRRYERGETQTDIARSYGVTPAAISNGIKKARISAADDPADVPSAEELPAVEPEADGDATAIHDIIAGRYRSDAAQRLADRTATVCQALEAAQSDKLDQSLKTAIHDVRRALAAIEIELARTASPNRLEAAQKETPRNPSGGNAIDAHVKFFDPERGFGFVVPDSGGEDIFIHATKLAEQGVESLDAAQPVRVRIKPGRKGPEVAELELV